MPTSERYRLLSRRAGIVCSACAIVFILAFCTIGFFHESAPRWTAVSTGLGLLGSLVSGVVCITSSVFGSIHRKKESAKNEVV